MACSQIPYATEQGIVFGVTGIFFKKQAKSLTSEKRIQKIDPRSNYLLPEWAPAYRGAMAATAHE
jgi:hypothetical protein